MAKTTGRRLTIAILSLLITFSATAVNAQVNTTRATSFGDSLTDNDFVYLIFGTDPNLYGRDPFEAMFQKAARTGDQLSNYAVLGSTSANVLTQVRSYAAARTAGVAAPSTIISIQAGANDFLDPENLAILAMAPPGASSEVDTIVDEIRQNLMRSIQTIRKLDRPQLVVWTIPDVTLLPYAQFIGLQGPAADNVRLHIERLNQFIRGLGNHSDIAVLDLSSLLTSATISPPVIAGVTLVPAPWFGFPTAVFADPLHPTAVSNGLTANLMIREVNAAFDDTIPVYTESELADMAGL